jgi:hypothetical protein
MTRSDNNSSHNNDNNNNNNKNRNFNANRRKIEPARTAPEAERGLTHSPYFNGPLCERMSQDLHLGGMAKRTHEGYLMPSVADCLGQHGETFLQRSSDKISLQQRKVLNH